MVWGKSQRGEVEIVWTFSEKGSYICWTKDVETVRQEEKGKDACDEGGPRPKLQRKSVEKPVQ